MPGRMAGEKRAFVAPLPDEQNGVFDVLQSPSSKTLVLLLAAGGLSVGGRSRPWCGPAGLIGGVVEEAGTVHAAARGIRWKVRLLSIAPQVRRRFPRQVAGGLDAAPRGNLENLAAAARFVAA